MTRKLTCTLIFVATSLFAQLPSSTRISDLSRKQGSVGGGDVMLVKIENPPLCDPIGCLFTVTFDGVPARTERIAFDLLRVVTPAHPPGNVEVGLNLYDREITKYGARFRYAGMSEISSPDTWNFETVLIPIAIGSERPVEGAYGSRWTTEFWVSNTGDHDVEFFSGYPRCAEANCSGTRFPVIPAHTTRLMTLPADETSAGYLFYAQKGRAEDLHFSLRVRDVSRSIENAGTEIPVPRFSSFQYVSKVHVLNVPIESRSRTSLRLYGFTSLRVRVFNMTDEEPLVDTAVTLRGLRPLGDGFPSRCGYAFIPDLAAEFPQLGSGRYRLEVSADVPFVWALAAVTNNETQLVTTISATDDRPYGRIRE